MNERYDAFQRLQQTLGAQGRRRWSRQAFFLCIKRYAETHPAALENPETWSETRAAEEFAQFFEWLTEELAERFLDEDRGSEAWLSPSDLPWLGRLVSGTKVVEAT